MKYATTTANQAMRPRFKSNAGPATAAWVHVTKSVLQIIHSGRTRQLVTFTLTSYRKFSRCMSNMVEGAHLMMYWDLNVLSDKPITMSQIHYKK